MGLFSTQWIQDMMDVSCGFGSWQLSMNAGLAHMQASSYLNSCWSPSGFGFMPYSQLDSMSQLLNPNFAAWQATHGIKSNPTNIFGNWGGMPSNYTNNTGFNPWDNMWNNNTQGNTGSSNSTQKAEDKENENKSKDLKKAITDYATYLEKQTNNNDKTYGKNLKDKISEIKKKESWKEVKEALEELYKDILNEDSKSYARFIARKTEKIGDKPLTELIQNTGIENSDLIDKNKGISDVINNIHSDIQNMSSDQSNQNNLADRCNEDTVLSIISYYNTDYENTLISDFVEKYNDLDEDTMKGTAKVGLQKLIKALNAKADDLISCVDDTTKDDIKEKIKTLNNYDLTGTIDTDIINDFNELYKLVRLAEVQKVEKEMDEQYNIIEGQKISNLLKLRQKTIMDLANELDEDAEDIGDLADSIEYVSAGHSVDVTNRDSNNGNGGIENNNESAIQAYIDDGTLEETNQKTANGQNIYIANKDTDRIKAGQLYYARVDNDNKVYVKPLPIKDCVEYNVKARILGQPVKIGERSFYYGEQTQAPITEGVYYVYDGNGLSKASDYDLGELFMEFEYIETMPNTETDSGQRVYKCKKDIDGDEPIRKGELCYFENGELKKYES